MTTIYKTKMDYYNHIQDEITKTYEDAKANNDEETMEAARTLMSTHLKVMADLESQDFHTIYQAYRDAKALGNDYPDLGETLFPSNTEAPVNVMRENNIEFFTFSSTWSGALQVAQAFEKAGCTCIGMTEIHTRYIETSGEHAKAPALLFKVQGVNDND